jgi:ABC-type multidrug transport system fused ATPase/permease subunit
VINVAEINQALLVLQSTAIAFSKVSTKTYELGIYGTVSSSLLLVVAFIQDSLLSQTRSSIGPIGPFVLRAIQLVLVICTAFANASLPRRPELFKDGKAVDSGETVSVFSKYSFAWCEPLLKLALQKGSLELKDLPTMDHNVRSKDATRTWIKADRKHSLWVNVALHHKWALIVQWALTGLSAVGNVTPQFVLFNVLKLLEKRGAGASVSSEAWIWVIALGLSTTITSWIESWLFWISQSDIAIPIRAELASLIFQKSMRRKDIKGATKQQTDVSEPERDTTAAGKPEEPKKDDSEAALTKQSTINLIAVDARRVADFASYNNYFPGSAFKLIVSFTFLIVIIGWKALLVGLLTMLLIMPLNVYWSKEYASAQSRLMKMRDEKLGVVTEALQGLRQLKFMSIEAQWQEKISAVRTLELSELWASFKADTMILLCWIASPIFFSVTSLSVYAYLYGELTPSVAFTAIGIFKNLEVTLAVVPELTTMLIDSYVSVQRIEKYLDAPEVSVNTKDSPNVSFDNASFSWPSDEEKEDRDQKYVLRNVNISFPENELSVVSGKTGTGKSMLLSAILGEVDIISGTINVPKPPSIWERHDHKATKANWIIPSSVAYVAQIPWIENATIKDNILFGLPYDEDRYIKILDACALRKDLQMMPDGDSTEIGSNGINLSGGQKWRLTFARALYSRAGILVLDDIFSAVDAHVGRFIYENALTGELGAGRTRILVTHHVALCKPRTKYLVELGDGTVEHAGFLSELEEDGILTKIITKESLAIEEEEGSTAVNSEESSDIDGEVEVLKKIDTKASAKKFVEDETKEKGAVSRAIYGEYLTASGGFPFWALAVVLFLSRQILSVGKLIYFLQSQTLQE